MIVQSEESHIRGRPPLRTWDLDSNSTRYERIVAAPSDHDLRIMWSIWAGVTFLVALFTLSIFVSILSSRKVRRNEFNNYLIYLMIPDFIFSLCCGVTCTMNAIHGKYWASWMCDFQQFYCIFGIGSNSWLNAVVMHQLYKMMQSAHHFRHYYPPSRIQIAKQAISVYLFLAFLGSWGFVRNKHFPYHHGAMSGLACLPIEGDRASAFMFWFGFFPFFALIPVMYVLYASFQVYYHGLLPKRGNRRSLTIYFLRLMVVFYVMWLPTFAILFFFGSLLPPWAHWSGGTWSHLQGAVSAGVCLWKPDIARAVRDFWTLRTLSRTCSKNKCRPMSVSSFEFDNFAHVDENIVVIVDQDEDTRPTSSRSLYMWFRDSVRSKEFSVSPSKELSSSLKKSSGDPLDGVDEEVGAPDWPGHPNGVGSNSQDRPPSVKDMEVSTCSWCKDSFGRDNQAMQTPTTNLQHDDNIHIHMHVEQDRHKITNIM